MAGPGWKKTARLLAAAGGSIVQQQRPRLNRSQGGPAAPTFAARQAGRCHRWVVQVGVDEGQALSALHAVVPQTLHCSTE